MRILVLIATLVTLTFLAAGCGGADRQAEAARQQQQQQAQLDRLLAQRAELQRRATEADAKGSRWRLMALTAGGFVVLLVVVGLVSSTGAPEPDNHHAPGPS